MKLIIFGAGYWGEAALSYFGEENVFCFCDNKVNKNAKAQIKGKEVISFPRLLEVYKEKQYVIVVAAGANYTDEICDQLEKNGIEDYFAYDVLVGIIKNVDEFMKKLQDNTEREYIFRRYYKNLAYRTKQQFEYLKRHVDITTLKPAQGATRRKQLQLLDFATEFFDFIKELEIKPFLTFGNLVGAFRHQGFIPWDDDMDFGLIRSEYDKLLEFARRKCIVGTRCGEIWIDDSGERISWEALFEKYRNHFIFDLRSDMLQIYKSSFGITQPGMDIWVYDFYKDGYSIVQHKKWIEEIAIKIQKLDTEKDKYDYVQKVRKENSMISYEETEQFYPGIDNWGGYPGLKNIDEWIKTKDIFPLKRGKYENVEFWVPNNMEGLLRHEYPSYMDFPYDMGIPLHSIMCED